MEHNVSITLSQDTWGKVLLVCDAYAERRDRGVEAKEVCELMVQEAVKNWLSEIRHGEHFTDEEVEREHK